MVMSLLVVTLPALVSVSTAGADSLQTSNNNSSNGWYPNEPTLTPSAVSPATGGTFGKIFDTSLSGKIYAQPLVDQGVVLTVTENGDAYGLNATTGQIIWTESYGAATPTNDPGGNECGDIGPSLGITGTPVIDSATNTAYFVDARATGPSRGSPLTPPVNAGPSTQYYLEAANVATGVAPGGWPAGGVLISGTADNDPGTTFQSDYQTQRPGLVLVNGVVYAAFSSQCDFLPPTGTYSGWLIGISAVTKSVTTMWATEIGGNIGAGIWQSGGAPVVDSGGNIYVVTGNSFSNDILPPGSPGFGVASDYGEAVVKLSTSSGKLTPVNWFVPANAAALDAGDLDFSSGGPIELPSPMGSIQEPNVLLAVGKEGVLYGMNMANLGGFQDGPGGGDNVPSELNVGGEVWSRPAAWPGDGGYIYLPTTGSAASLGTGSAETLKAFKEVVSASGAVGFQLAGSTGAATLDFGTGAPVVTSNGAASGSSLVWDIQATGVNGAGGELVAYDPIPRNPGTSGTLTPVWTSATSGAFLAEKYTAPGVGNGVMYVGTQDGQLLGYGFVSATPALTGDNVDFSSTVISQPATLTATFTNLSSSTSTTVDSLALSGSAFTMGSPSLAAGSTLLPNQSITVPITFTPNALGDNEGTITANTLTGTTSGSTTLNLSGVGIPSTSTVVASPASVDFGAQPIAGGSISVPVTMTNTSNSSINITGFMAPVATTPFSVTNAPVPGVLASNQSVHFTVNFLPPGSSGNYSHIFGSVVTLETSAGDFGVPLSGTAAPPAVLTFAPTSLSFGNVTVGQSVDLPVVVENNGGVPITIDTSSPPSANVGLSVTALMTPTVIGPNATVDETVQFTPTATGLSSDTWTVTGHDGTDQQSATLTMTGTGVTAIAPPPVALSSPPSAPTIGTATLGNAQATVSWSAPVSDGGAAITGYNVMAEDATMVSRGGQTCAGVAKSTSCTVTGLTDGDSYTFTVRATNIAGTGPASNSTNSIVPTASALPPGAPSIGTATAGNASATMTWNAPTSDGGSSITSYNGTAVDTSNSARGGQSCIAAPATTSCTFKGLTNGDSYTFTVSATNAVGTGVTSGVSNTVVPTAPVSTPTKLNITTRTGSAGSPTTLRVSGESPGGLVSFVTVNGTAHDCRIVGDTLRSATGGTCVVVAYSPAHGQYPLVMSTGSVVMMSGKVVPTLRFSVTVAFKASRSDLSPAAKATLVALAKSLPSGVALTITGSAGGNSALAKARATNVKTDLEQLVKARVSVNIVTSTSSNVATITGKTA